LLNKKAIDLCVLAAYLCTAGSRAIYATPQSPQLVAGVQAFQQHQWLDAMAKFLEVLKKDPSDAEAHKYIPLTIREIEAQNHAVAREMRLSMLSGTTQRLATNRLNYDPIEAAVADMTHSEERNHEERWNRWLEEAKVEHAERHLLAANDIVLRIINEKPSHEGAQKELSQLQSDIRTALDKDGSLLVQERYALQGFYAYGQSDYDSATTAWTKAVTILQQTYPAAEVDRVLATLHFKEYDKYAEAQVAERIREAKIQSRFAEGVELFQNEHYARALEAFREVALAKPEYPNLSLYLVKSETGVEKERTRMLTEARRQEIAASLQKGVDQMERENYADAREAFRKVLSLDPSNPTAGSYLTAVEAEIHRLHDPQAAQAHYEAGLIAYASGKLDEAVREWHIATRMNPENEKAQNALAKVQKELALNRSGGDLPNEALP
jgi:tetratricopeptide (TPR) repeat protein